MNTSALLPEVLSNQSIPVTAERTILPNGLIVVHDEDHSNPIASVQIWVKTGSIHETVIPGAGLSHFLEHMLFKGTPRRPGGSIATEVQGLGGQINAYTSFDRTVYHIDLPSDQTAGAMDVLSDMVFNASLTEEDFIKERDVILREIDMGLDDHSRQLGRTVFSTAFTRHPFRYPVIGIKDLFLRITHQDLRSYHRERYNPANMVLVVTGAVSSEELDGMLKKYWQSESMRPLVPVWIPEEPQQLARRYFKLTGDVKVCRGVMAFQVPALSHPDAPALDMLASILGGGMSSLLWESLREQLKLVHSIEAMVWNPGSIGLFWISYLCDLGKSADVEAAILNDLRSIAEIGIAESDLQKTRRQALVSEISSRQTMSGLASKLGMAEAVIGDLSYPEVYLNRLAGVTVEKLGALLTEYLVKDRLISVTYDRTPAAVGKTAIVRRKVEDFVEHRLSNGARLVLQRDARLPKVHFCLSGLGGPMYELPHERGLSSLMTTLLTRDTTYRSALEVATAAESAGISMHEYSGDNTFGLALECLRGDVGLAIDLLEEAALQPLFRAETFAKERDAQIARLAHDNDEIFTYGLRALRRNFFGAHPFSIDADGEQECLVNLASSDARLLYRRLMVAPNMVLGVCGDFDPDNIILPLEAMLKDLPEWHFQQHISKFSGPVQAGEFVEELPREQSVVFQAYPDCGLLGKEHDALKVLAEMLSDMSGPLFGRVREDESLAYFVGANRLLGFREGMFYVYAGTHPGKVDRVKELLDDELEKIVGSGVDADLFERTRTHIKSQLLLQRQSLSSRLHHAVIDVLAGRSANHWKEISARIDALTPDDVQAVAARMFTINNRLSITVGPEHG